MSLPSIDDYARAMEAYGAHPIRVEMTLLQLTMLLSSLQLALRHPDYPDTMREYVAPFVADAIASVTTLSPVIGAVIQAGNDPAQDA